MYTNWLIHSCHVEKIKSGPEEKKNYEKSGDRMGVRSYIASHDFWQFCIYKSATCLDNFYYLKILEEEMEALPTTTVWKGEPEKHVARFLSERITEDAGCDSLWCAALSSGPSLCPSKNGWLRCCRTGTHLWPFQRGKKKHLLTALHRCALIDFSSYVAQVFKINLSALWMDLNCWEGTFYLKLVVDWERTLSPGWTELQ